MHITAEGGLVSSASTTVNDKGEVVAAAKGKGVNKHLGRLLGLITYVSPACLVG